ncbi:MAG: GTPase HflX, partial [Ectothiorhodospiraceae bacterium]
MVTSNPPTHGASALSLFERPDAGERALLVHLDTGGQDVSEALAELRSLAASAGAEEVDTLV